MESNDHNVIACESSMKKNKAKFVWDHTTLMKFIDLCLIELKKGKSPGTHFKKVGWTNLEKGMLEKTGKKFDKKQLKNKWYNMKKEWQLYNRLLRLETGIDGTKTLKDATPEWWDEKLKVDKDFAKFRDTNLEIYELHYAPLFRDSVAIGDKAMTPLQFKKDSSPNPNDVEHVENIENMEDKGDSDETNLGGYELLFPSFTQSSSSKRKNMDDDNSRLIKAKLSSYEEKLDVVLEALLARNKQIERNNLTPTIKDCINIVTCFTGFEEGSRMYTLALRVFLKKENREGFMFPTSNEAKMEFLKLLMEE